MFLRGSVCAGIGRGGAGSLKKEFNVCCCFAGGLFCIRNGTDDLNILQNTVRNCSAWTAVMTDSALLSSTEASLFSSFNMNAGVGVRSSRVKVVVDLF